MSEGRLEPLRAGVITVWAVTGLVVGWLLRPIGLSVSLFDVAPVVSWVQPLILGLIAAILGGTAWITHRQLHVLHSQVEAYRTVNRLVLARACVLVGALLAGGYVGYAVSWLGQEGDQIVGDRVLRPAFAGIASIAVLVTARLLEHACRVREDDGDKA